MPSVKIGAVKLLLVPEDGKSPEHLTWKKVFEREWAGEWGTLAKLTDYCYKMALDPSFYYERPEYRTGKLHHYEWILCHNSGLIYLYSQEKRLGLVWTSKTLGEKILKEVPGARVFRTSYGYLHYEIMFSLDHIHQVCELAGPRRSRRGKRVSEEAKERLRRVGFGSARRRRHHSEASGYPLITIQRPQTERGRVNHCRSGTITFFPVAQGKFLREPAAWQGYPGEWTSSPPSD